MKKIILALFIILFCFTLGITQEKELSKEEKAELKKNWDKQLEILDKLLSLSDETKKLRQELERLEELERQITEKDVYKLIFEDSKKEREEEKDIMELMKEASKPEEKDDFSWLDKYKDLTKKEYKKDDSWFNKNARTIWVTKTDEEKLEEENDRLEDLIWDLERIKRDIESERYALDLDMIHHRWSMLELSSRLEFDLLFNPLLSFPFDYRYTHPGYSKKMDPINYEALLFTLSTDSKGKMDWTKYGWLKLLLNNK